MIPAQRLYYLLLLGMAIALLIANFLGLELAISVILFYDITLLIVAIWDGNQVKQNQVKVSRNHLFKLSIARDNPVILTVKSVKKSAKLLIKDYYPQQFSVSLNNFRLQIADNTSQDLIYTIKPDQRGEFEWGNIQVRQLSNLGLMWYDYKISASQKVAVYPDLMGLKSLSIRLAIENTGTMRQIRRLGQGTEFSELREYSTGDDTRIIDWKATARRSRPIVRVLEPEQEQTIIILLDQGRLMTAQVQGIQRFDWGLNATLSLALAGLNRGDRVGIAVFDKEVTTWIPPERGTHQLSRLIEKLTTIKPVLLEPDYVNAVTKVVTQQSRRALVVLITDIIDAIASSELLIALAKLQPRYLPFCVTLRDPQIDEIAHNHTDNITEAYQRAVALDVLSQRELAFAKLKQKGVLVLDAPASKISEQLVNNYLRLKAKSKL